MYTFTFYIVHFAQSYHHVIHPMKRLKVGTDKPKLKVKMQSVQIRDDDDDNDDKDDEDARSTVQLF